MQEDEHRDLLDVLTLLSSFRPIDFCEARGLRNQHAAEANGWEANGCDGCQLSLAPRRDDACRSNLAVCTVPVPDIFSC